MVNLLVDDKEIQAEPGANLLQICLKNDIYIPNLCFLEQMTDPPASCRMCLVEIEGQRNPVTACTTTVTDGMRVRTDTEEVRALQKSAFQLLLSVHDVDCGHCPANKQCELQKIAKFLKIGLKTGNLEKVLKSPETKNKHPLIDCNPNRCVLCGKCVYICKKKHGQPLMYFAKRGFQTMISFYGLPESAEARCRSCMACVDICPVGALTAAEG